MDIITKERRSKFIIAAKNNIKDIICPSRFNILCWGHQCLFNPCCSYCYLHYTARFIDAPIVYKSNKILDEVQQWLKNTSLPHILNTGELADSFMLQNNQILANLMDMFEAQTKHKLLFVTKNNIIPAEIENNIYTKKYVQTIFSFSVNSAEFSSKYEKGVPNPFERLATAYRIKKQGQRVRIRIDPIVEIKDYKTEYKNLIDVLNSFLQPERVTLGSLWLFQTLPQVDCDEDVAKYVIDNNDRDKKLRIPFEKRIEIYQWFIKNLQISEIGLCKETIQCHRALKFRKDMKCNCNI